MSEAKNGSAIIDGQVVPAAEVSVLRTLAGLQRPATVHQIAERLQGALSDASLYSLLGRLRRKRSLVTREDVIVEVTGTPLKRVFWAASSSAVSFFSGERDGA